MKITDILQPTAILLNTTFATKEAALDAMIDALSSGGHITKVEEARKAVFDREKIMSTGIGKGFALPHGKTNHITETVGAFMTLKEPLDFQALDQHQLPSSSCSLEERIRSERISNYSPAFRDS